MCSILDHLADLKMKVNPRNIEAKSICCYIFATLFTFEGVMLSSFYDVTADSDLVSISRTTENLVINTIIEDFPFG